MKSSSSILSSGLCEPRSLRMKIMAAGTPWFAKYGLTTADLHNMRAAEGWHARYGGGTAKLGPTTADPNAVY